eukprot:50016-Eustigmatos_ZCMA.PRE.1
MSTRSLRGSFLKLSSLSLSCGAGHTQGPGTDLVAVHALLEEVMATGFGRGSLVHYTRDAQPFVDHCSIEPIINS